MPARTHQEWQVGSVRSDQVTFCGTAIRDMTVLRSRAARDSALASDVWWCPRVWLESLGRPGPARVKRLRGLRTANALANREFHRLLRSESWVSDVTEHPKPEISVVVATAASVGRPARPFNDRQRYPGPCALPGSPRG